MSGRDDTVALTVGSMEHRGWTRVSIEHSLETICGGFELQVTERWPGQQASFAIGVGDRCTLTIGEDTVITGYVDDVDPGYDKEAHDIIVRGRDAAGDLVDCSTLAGVAQLPSGPALNLIQQICQPFGIKVAGEVSQAQTAVTNLAVQLSETAFETISRIAEQSGFLVVSDGRGGLQLTNAGAAGGRAAVVLGQNILAARGFSSMRRRYSQYVVASQTIAPDSMDPTSATIAQGKATDPGVPRYRPLVIIADLGFNGPNYFQQRAEWEATVRLGRAFRPRITVRGWRDDSGALWAPNTLVRVEDEWLAVDRDLLVSGVRYLLDDEDGTRAELTLTLPQAFAPAPIPFVPTIQNAGGAV
jgi:prophage tail gpP-like protein